jgi:hypothetical protein
LAKVLSELLLIMSILMIYSLLVLEQASLVLYQRPPELALEIHFWIHHLMEIHLSQKNLL